MTELAAKHRHELAADLRDGEVRRGAAHAGLVIGADPRTDRPEVPALGSVLTGADDRIRRGWARAAARSTGMHSADDGERSPGSAARLAWCE